MNQLYQFKFRKKYDLVLCIQQCCGIDDKQLRIKMDEEKTMTNISNIIYHN